MCQTLTYKGRECKVLGTVGASRPCDCCGNTMLEKAVAILVDDCEVYEIGKVCASKAIFGSGRYARKIQGLAEAADAAARFELQSIVRRAAFRMVHPAETDGQKFNGSAAQEALYRFLKLGRKVEGRRPWFRGEWVVAVDTNDAADVKLWSEMGFAPRAA